MYNVYFFVSSIMDMFDVGCKERKDERNDIVVSRFHKILASGFGVLLLEVEDKTSLRFAWSQSRSKSEIRQLKLQHLYTEHTSTEKIYL